MPRGGAQLKTARLKGLKRSLKARIKIRASRSFDRYLIDLNPATPFANMSIHCPDANSNPNLPTFADALDGFAVESGVDEIERVLKSRAARELRSQFNRWKDVPSSGATQKQVESVLPALKRPLTLYRAYIRGIHGVQPVVGSDYDIGSKEPFLSFSLSQAFIARFTGKRNIETLHVRLDAMPGTFIVPITRDIYGNSLFSECEVIVPNFYRVHVYDPTTVIEGRVRVPSPPMTFGCLEEPLDTLPMIDYFFIMSLPGTVVEYYPNYQDPTSSVPTGGNRALRLNDGNQLGVGNVHEIIHRHIRSR